mmetsp:Transcript_2560/g.5701  ORF Transcript_2560/g.5701 Transcript_2560/m.5701 type:complete len:206 (+) Transcript_2560:38-655(+)
MARRRGGGPGFSHWSVVGRIGSEVSRAHAQEGTGQAAPASRILDIPTPRSQHHPPTLRLCRRRKVKTRKRDARKRRCPTFSHTAGQTADTSPPAATSSRDALRRRSPSHRATTLRSICVHSTLPCWELSWPTCLLPCPPPSAAPAGRLARRFAATSSFGAGSVKISGATSTPTGGVSCSTDARRTPLSRRGWAKMWTGTPRSRRA